MTKVLFDPLLVAYSEKYSSPEHPILHELRRQAHLELMQSVMLSSPTQVQLLQMLIKLSGASNILEIGTYAGYASLAMAMAMPENSYLCTIEIDEERAEFAHRQFEKYGYSHKIDLKLGNAQEIIVTHPRNWDMVFIDADKTAYLNYYQLLVPMVSNGALLIADNVLYEGKVLNSIEDMHKNELAIQRFNEYVLQDNRTEVLMLPIRDGLSIIRKI